VDGVSEERKLILQMVAEGKITADEADNLLQALEDTERVARDTAAEQIQQRQETAGAGRSVFADLGETIEHAVGESLKGLDAALRGMETKLEGKLNDPRRHELRHSVEEKIRRSVEASLEKARRAEERATRAAERAAERARETTERTAERAARRAEHMAHRMERLAGEGPVRIFKTGIAIDKVSVERDETLSLPAQPGDCLVLDNRVGDVRVEFYDGQEIQVRVHTQAWGEDEEDANVRADASKVQLIREGSEVVVTAPRPTIITVLGFVKIQRTRMDFTIRAPHGTRLNITNKAGDTFVTSAREVSNWELTSKVGNVEVQLTPEAGCHFEIRSEMGHVETNLVQPVEVHQVEDGKRGKAIVGKAGDAGGRLWAHTKTGDIRVTN
jgi:polyhydroxyalkanoate synthesis regulator phasin